LSAEKKSLKRFLLIYVISTLLLLGIGEWFYYKSKVHSIIDSEASFLRSELKIYLTENKMMFRMFMFNRNLPSKFKIAVFRDKEYMFGNFKPKKVFWNKEFWIEGDYLYYLYTMPKRWSKIDFVVTKKIDKKPFNKLKMQIIIFNIFALIFIFLMALVLGKMFLKPMRDTLNSLENFIRDATHEMNTPISVILTNIEMLKMKNTDFKELKRIEFSAKRLEKIFKDLSFIRLNHKRKKEFKKINLKELISNRLSIFETLIEGKNLHLKKDCEDFVINADEEDIIRLIDNLLSNAVKYAPESSTVYITLKNGVLSIKNKGEIKNPEKLTAKFYRENKNEGGFGLGLYIVSKICETYGFKFEIYNDTDNVVVEIDMKTQS
jgi:two-component system OmpR family sensor kinase